MRRFLLHLAVALLWVLMWGAFDLYTLLAGIAIAFLFLSLTDARSGGGGVGAGVRRRVNPWRLVRFLAYFVKILVLANWQVAKLVLNPAMPIRPRLIRYDVAGLTPVQITALANAITLTPGTLVVDVSPDDRVLYVHCINATDRARAVRELDELRDRLMTEVFA